MILSRGVPTGICTLLCEAAFVAAAVGQPQSAGSAPALDAGFNTRALAHVRQLASFGVREAGSKGGRRAAGYIREQMRKAGLSVIEEPFTFQTFDLGDAVVEAGAENAAIGRLGFNPYIEKNPITGEMAFVMATDVRSVQKADLDGKIVLIAGNDGFSTVSFHKKPRALVSLRAADFDRLKATGATSGEIRFVGEYGHGKSSNIIGVMASRPGPRQIIVSAHYDSWRGPGANDNASGVAVLLELARYFRGVKMPEGVSLRFVSFGAEESGLLGSKAYLQKHLSELRNCELIFNIDQVGGDSAIYVDTRGGVRGVGSEIRSQLPTELADKAARDTGGRWSLLMSSERALYASSNVPEWLRSAVSRAGAGLGREVIEQNFSGSDHRVFVQAGVAGTDITVAGGAETHGPGDVPEAVDVRGMEVAARLVAGVIQNVLRSHLASSK